MKPVHLALILLLVVALQPPVTRPFAAFMRRPAVSGFVTQYGQHIKNSFCLLSDTSVTLQLGPYKIATIRF